MIPVLILLLLIALIPAYIAERKGRSFFQWYIYALLLWIVALPASLLISPTEKAQEHQQKERGYRKCPYCAELIKQAATVWGG